jgi:hypothetical protein
MPMESSESTTALEIIKKEQEKAARDLINGMADLQDTLTLVLEENGDKNSGECLSLAEANEALISFLDSKPIFQTALPRTIKDKDRSRILPGQHAGVFAQFFLNDGTILKINFWGGLRTPAEQDLRDTDRSLSVSHTRRTEAVLGQVTHLNWQIGFPGGSTIDSWIAYNPDNNGSFQQRDLLIDKVHVDCNPNISSNDSRFESIKKGVLTPIDRLVKLVPTSV